jgi:hypothetical protein
MGWFDTTEVLAQARALAEEYCRMRASGVATGTAPDRLQRRFDKVAASASDYSRTLGMNVYKKSRFLQALQSGLEAQAVPAAEAEAFVRSILVRPLKAAPGPPARP